ncbi:hypothetical protein APSETT444_010243 [Aspergillus pseudonomiae]
MTEPQNSKQVGRRRRPRVPDALRKRAAQAASTSPQRDSDKERCLERIVRHFMGDISFEPSSLQFVADALERDRTGDSHDPFRATGLQSPSSIVASARKYFPPRHIADFLLETFLEYTQTNYYYFDETEFRQKLDYYYTEDRYLDINDAGWICTLFMTFASGTQFAYMHASRPPYLQSTSGEDHLPDDTIGLALYRFSCRLIPDLITTASVETVQAFLLFGVYTMPIDTSGLAYTYLGLAIKMAIQNGMHRQFGEEGLDARTIELRNRLWWSAYALDRSRLRKCPVELHQIYLKQLLHVRDELRSWWTTLPEDVHCRDLDPSKPLFRYNVHLEMTYATIIMYMGRPLILAGTPSSSASAEDRSDSAVDAGAKLCFDCVQAALRIVELCQMLQDTVGVARVSYTEFSSCRAALLAIIAQNLNTRTERLRGALTQGMSLIRRMCIGLQSARSEIAVIEALERAARRLDSRAENEDTGPGESGVGYNQFRRWAMLWQSETPPSNVGDESEPIGHENSQLPAGSFDGFFSSFPQELGAFASFPETEVQFGESLPTMLWPDDLSLPAFPPNPDAPV